MASLALSPGQDIHAAILDAVNSAPAPLSLKQIQLPKISQVKLRAEVLRLVEEHRLHKFPGRSLQVWHLEPSAYLRTVMLDLASKTAMTRAALGQAARKKVSGFPQTRCMALTQDLLRAAELVEHKLPGSRSKLVVKAGHSAALLPAAKGQIAPLLAMLEKAGVTRQQIISDLFGSPSGLPPEEKLMRALEDLDPLAKLELSAGKVRNHSANEGLSKEEFDRAAINLAQKHRVFLARHDDPYNTPEQERQQLIFAAPNTYYVTIARRN